MHMGTVYERQDSGQWWISYSVGGRRFRRVGGKTKAQASALLAKVEVEIFEGKHFPDKRKAGLTLAGLQDLWFEHAANKKSVKADQSRFDTVVSFFGASTQITGLAPADIEKLKALLTNKQTRFGKPMAPASVNRHLEVLRAALRVADANGHFHRNPMRGVKFLDEHNERDRVATPDEYEQLVDAAAPKLRLAIVLGFHTGMRLGEIAGLTWEQIDLRKRVVRLHSSETKTGYGRTVPLSPEAIEALKAWPRSLDGGRLIDVAATSLSPLFSRLCRRLEIKDLRFHDLRHSALTNLRRAGADVFTISAISGHKSLSMLKRYQTISDDDLHDAIAKVGKLEER